MCFCRAEMGIWLTKTVCNDLDGERVTPVDVQQSKGPNSDFAQAETAASVQEREVEFRSFRHIGAQSVVILPFKFLRDLGGVIHPLALQPGAHYRDEEGAIKAGEFLEDMKTFITRAAMTIFVGDRGKDQVVAYSSMSMSPPSGLKGLVIPIVIAFLIVHHLVQKHGFAKDHVLAYDSGLRDAAQEYIDFPIRRPG